MRKLFEVQRMASRNEFRTVYIGALKCSCVFLQEEALPCMHVCAACLFKAVYSRSSSTRSAGPLQALFAGSTVALALTLILNDRTHAPAYSDSQTLMREHQSLIA